MAAFKIGDIVQLKSGGPKMTVTNATLPSGKDIVTTSWFAGSKKETGNFPTQALVAVSDEQSK